jgi:Dna[CI] antecedent DciA-like protein
LPRSSRHPTFVADVVARLLAQRHGHPSRGKEALALKVFDAFRRIGPPITEHAEPAYFKNGILSLTVGESVWLTELTFLKPELIARINHGLGRDAVEDLRLRQGKLERRRPRAEVKPPVLSNAQKERVERWGAMIADENVRQAVMKAAARSITTPRRGKIASGPPGPLPSPAEPPPKAPEPVDRWPKGRDRWKDRG